MKKLSSDFVRSLLRNLSRGGMFALGFVLIVGITYATWSWTNETQLRDATLTHSDWQEVIDKIQLNKNLAESAANTQTVVVPRNYIGNTADNPGTFTDMCPTGQVVCGIRVERKNETINRSPNDFVLTMEARCCSMEPVSYSWQQAASGGCSGAACPSTPGTQSYTVTCRRNDGQTVGDSFCNAATKPATSQACFPSGCGGGLKGDRFINQN